ncbi:MAG: BCCT family transporter [Rhodobacteraceae bacterium]|nr:BCCT family transporter [Paracoccaceae bacterium]
MVRHAFSAGIGIGILFFGVAEPIFYFDNSGGFGYPNNSHAMLQVPINLISKEPSWQMRTTYFHWGFHGWAAYVFIGLCLVYFGFRKKLPLTLCSAL